ncbi:MAG: DUF5605 domain-containing protein [Eubacteriales bacterium]|nr:DUF5605 domain-containing protein [Eubacteriales bacterium]
MLKSYTEAGQKYGVLELVLEGPKEGNPFRDQWVRGRFVSRSETKEAEGFYDGDGCYRVRFMPSFAEEYTCKVTASWGEEAEAVIPVGEAAPGNHGPVRVANTFHFAYDDGTPFYPVGTTCYVWHLQPEEVREKSYESFAKGPFNKVRFCIFPKHYIYNLKEPKQYPFQIREDSPWKPEDYNAEFFAKAPRTMFGGIEASVGDPEKVWDFEAPNPAYFAAIEEDIKRLGELGIEADLILFHPYDRWGFSKMGVEHENFYLRYLVNRFAAFHNVWWAMANEFDLFRWKTEREWESNAAVVCRQDPYRHLRSIHNCMTMYDHTRAWITHCSLQRIDLYRTAENTEIWRTQYGKPCVLDEIAYEGDLPYGWGNISGEEMTRRFWEAYTRGGYGQHGETFEREDEVIWWSHGGTLHGDSPARIAFLRQIMEENGGYMEPQPAMFDETCVANRGPNAKKDCLLYYYGANRPCRRSFRYPGQTFEVEVIDTWNMTVEAVGQCSGEFTVTLPRRPYMAVRLTRVSGS